MTSLTIQELFQKISEGNKSIDMLEKIKSFAFNPISNIEDLIRDIKLQILDTVDEIDRRTKAAVETMVVTVIYTTKE